MMMKLRRRFFSGFSRCSWSCPCCCFCCRFCRIPEPAPPLSLSSDDNSCISYPPRPLHAPAKAWRYCADKDSRRTGRLPEPRLLAPATTARLSDDSGGVALLRFAQRLRSPAPRCCGRLRPASAAPTDRGCVAHVSADLPVDIAELRRLVFELRLRLAGIAAQLPLRGPERWRGRCVEGAV